MSFRKCEDESLTEFVEKCCQCTRRLFYYPGPESYCPHFKKTIEDVYNDLYSELEDDKNVPICPSFLPIGGIKDTGPKYKPVENCSLNGFVEGLK